MLAVAGAGLKSRRYATRGACMERLSSTHSQRRSRLLLLTLTIAGAVVLLAEDSAGPATARAQVFGVLAPSLEAAARRGSSSTQPTDIMQQGDHRRAGLLRGSGVSDLLIGSVGLAASAGQVLEAFGVQDHEPAQAKPSATAPAP